MCFEEKNILLLPGIKPRIFGYPLSSPVTTADKLFRLPTSKIFAANNLNFIFYPAS
jgi:hypothetical protein